MAVGGVELKGLLRLGGCFHEFVTGGEDIGQMARGSGVPRREFQRPSKRLFRQGEVAQVPGLPGLLDVGVTKLEIRRRVLWVALDLTLSEPDGLVRRPALCRHRSHAWRGHDREGRDDDHHDAGPGSHRFTRGR